MTHFVDVKMPADQTEGTESVAGAWFKQVGESVEENEPLLEINTDKVTVEIAAPASGLVAEILVPEGEPIDPTTVLGRIAVGAEAPGAVPPKPEGRPSSPIPSKVTSTAVPAAGAGELSPPVRRLIEQHGLDPAGIAGTGRGGRITVQDVERRLAEAAGAGSAPEPIPSHRVPHTVMRKRIAQHMAASVQTAPHVTAVFQADLTRILADKARRQAEGVSLTLTAYFVRAIAAALEVVPEVNSRWHDDAIEIFDTLNLGIATALEEAGGLIAPVLRQAESLDLVETARRIQDLVGRARDGSLTPAEVQGGTFTISNHGVSGSLLAAPIIINQPQSAILGIGKLEHRIVVVDPKAGETAIRPMVYVTLTIDHRVLDGHQANRFLSRFVSTLEEWD